jgi:hypothetical protein
VSNDRRAPMQLGDRSQIDRESQHHLLPFAQSEIGRFNEYPGGAQIDCFAELPTATRNGDIDNGSCTVPRVQAAFHFNQPRVFY